MIKFAIDIFKEANLPTKVVPIATEEYPQKATRPKNSKLSKEKMKQHGFSEMPSYQDALKRYIKELTDTC